MALPVNPPLKPMLAKAVEGLPERDDLIFEPKWDGFRCIVFRDGDEVILGSRNERPLTRYFPEMVEPIRNATPDRCVIDGELIVATDNHLDFEALQQRIHPAESRVNMLAEKTPAAFIAFDAIAIGDEDLRSRPFGERRARLEQILADAEPPVYLTKTTTDHAEAAEWFRVFEGAGLDGLIAKPIDDPYVEDKRTQLKVKHIRTADAVVAGFRWHKDGEGVGSLLLGLYNDGTLHHVGVAASFTKKRRSELVDELKPLTEGALEDHPWKGWADAEAHAVEEGRMPGAPHRWSAKKDHRWVPLRIERVVEVKYGSTLNGRFREVTKVLRWRPDKEPAQCDFDQLDEPIPVGLDTVLEAPALMASSGESIVKEIGGHELKISNPDKVFFTKRGETKLDLIDYYEAVEGPLIAAMGGRPTLMQRFPDGASGKSFFQKRVPKGAPKWFDTTVVSTPNGTTSNAMVATDLAHIAWAAQMGCLGFHLWPYKAADPAHTDELRIDLDPSPGIDFEDIRAAARLIKDYFDELAMPAFPKTTGSRGLHVFVKLLPQWDSYQVRAGAVALARELERRHPDRLTAAWWKEERGSRVFIDFNQNAPHKTVFGAWSVRSRVGAQVSTPFHWDELDDIDPDQLTMDVVPGRVEADGDPWAPMYDTPSSLQPLLDAHDRDMANGLTDAPWPPVYPKMPNEPPRVAPSRARKEAT